MNEKEYREEVAFLTKCNQRYHETIFGESEISDSEYDRRRRVVQNYEIAKGIPEEDRFSSRVGLAPARGAVTRKHTRPRKSLENALNKKEAQEWFDRWSSVLGKGLDLIAEYKYDGAATVLRYADGCLVMVLTRGDGETGEDITSHAMAYVAQHIDAPGEVEIEGESVVTAAALRVIERHENSKYANCRAAVSGLLLRKETTNLHQHLRFVPYGITMDGAQNLAQSDRLKLLREMGFETGPYIACTPDNAEETFVEMVKSQTVAVDYDCDGVVFKINSPDKQSIVGETNHSPRWAFAYKKPPVIGICTLLGVDFQIGRSGEISPVAKITPTILQGVAVTSAYLHNEKRMRERGIYIGSSYEIYRSGDVIPHLGDCVSRTASSTEVEFPTTCPCCASAVEKQGEIYYCTQRGMCPGAQEAKIIFAVSREALNIDGVGEVIVRNLIKEWYLKNVADLYDLTAEDIVAVGCGPTVAAKIVQEIENSRNGAGYRFLVALSIAGVGKATARAIASNVGAIKNFLKWTDVKDIVSKKVSGVGAVTAKAIADYLNTEETAKVAQRLLANSNITGSEPLVPGAIYLGITDRQFVFTGSFSRGKEALEEMVIARRGRVSSAVSKETAYVVRGDKPGKKLQAAHANGVAVIDEAEFLYRIDNCVVIGSF